MRPAEEPRAAAPSDGAAYAQPTPRLLYVHDDLSDEVGHRLGPGSAAAALTRSLFELLRRDQDRVIVLTLAKQVDRVIAHGSHAPFDLALGVALHERTGWFPRVRRVGLTREEDGRGGYRLISTERASLAEQLAGVADCPSLAVVDDTVFSGLTMRSVLEALPTALPRRTHAFCLRAVAESLPAVARLCPVTVGVAAAGRMLKDVSFINASGLVLRVGIRREGQAPLAFFERPDWIRAWFPGSHAEVIDLCRRLNALLEEEAD
jgi:hypothetical protein